MSDEESLEFVILGTSPTASMETVDSLPATESLVNKSSETPQTKSTNNGLECQLTNSAASSNTSQYTVVNKSNEHSVDSSTNESFVSINQNKPETNGINGVGINSMQNSGSSNSSVNGTLATSFILGQVDSNVLKSSLQSQFPNILSTTPPVSQSDSNKDIFEEYEKLKMAVAKTNQTMQFMYDQSVKWKKKILELEDGKKNEIAKLRNENMELRKDIEMKVEHIRINEEQRALEQQELIRSLSEKQSQINNMSAQIDRLEQQQLQSYDFIPKNDQDTSNQPEGATEYVTRLEYQRVVVNFQARISELTAENLQLKEMQKLYIDEINALKVQLVAAEELHKKAQADIGFLKANDLDKSQTLEKHENECKVLRDDVDILRQQLELYSRDFKIEHEARENLANEKDQLLTDLRELQKKNQELIKEAQKNYEEHARQTMAPTGAFPKRRILPDTNKLPQASNPMYAPTTYKCPLCGRIFKTLGVLQEHVNQCLDGN